MINLNLLDNFAVLYRTGNITKASKELYMTRQALSLNVQTLEKELDTTLFYRSNRGLIPTSSADILYKYYKKIDGLCEKMIQEIKSNNSLPKMRIALHLMYYTAEELRTVKQSAKLLTGTVPRLININDSEESVRLLESDAVDFVITHKPPNSADVSWRRIADAKAFALMREDNPLAGKKVIDFTIDFTGKNLIFASAETMHEVEKILVQQGATCSVIDSDRVLLNDSILTDNSIMVIPEQCIDNFKSEGMETKELCNFPVINGIYVVFREETELISRYIDLLFYSNKNDDFE